MEIARNSQIRKCNVLISFVHGGKAEEYDESFVSMFFSKVRVVVVVLLRRFEVSNFTEGKVARRGTQSNEFQQVRQGLV